MTPGQKFREAVRRERPLQVAGVIHALAAKLAQQAGFRALYVSGAGVANASFGKPDLGLTTLEQVAEEVSRISGATHSFTAPGSPVPWVKVEHTKGGKEVTVESGVKEWLILKSTQSGFEGYPKCEFTTLPETNDRIFATAVTAGWKWTREPKSYTESNRRILEAMSGPFLEKFSPSVQTTMYQMGEEALKACAEISEVSLAMPNKHCLLFNLKPFGMENPNVIFTATDEPHGQIEAVIRRT